MKDTTKMAMMLQVLINMVITRVCSLVITEQLCYECRKEYTHKTNPYYMILELTLVQYLKRIFQNKYLSFTHQQKHQARLQVLQMTCRKMPSVDRRNTMLRQAPSQDEIRTAQSQHLRPSLQD